MKPPDAPPERDPRLTYLEAFRAEISAALSHDLRSPLAALKLLAGMLADEADKTPPEALRRQAELILRSVEGFDGALSRLLDAIRLDNGQVALSPEPLSLRALAGEVFARLAPAAGRSGVGLSLPEAAPEGRVRGDPERLRRALGYLAESALRYAPRGSEISLSLAERPATRLPAGRAVSLAITDRGPAVPDAERALLFERFSQGTRRRGSLDLGLHIAAALITLHGGATWAETPAGGGLTVAVELPAAD